MLVYTYHISDLFFFLSRWTVSSIAATIFATRAMFLCVHSRQVWFQHAAECGTSSGSVNGEAVKANEENFHTISVSSPTPTHISRLYCVPRNAVCETLTLGFFELWNVKIVATGHQFCSFCEPVPFLKTADVESQNM